MSSRELIVRYLRERGRLAALVSLSLLMAGTGWASRDSTQMTAIGFAAAALTAFLLVLAFRIWDDLEDRVFDAEHHPGRVIAIAGSVEPLHGLALALLVLAAFFVAATPDVALRLSVLCISACVLVVWYRARSPHRRGLANAHVVLLKYPAIAFAAAPVTPSLTALAALYLGLCVYEVADDPLLRRSLAARRLAISEVALVFAAIGGVTLLGGRLP